MESSSPLHRYVQQSGLSLHWLSNRRVPSFFLSLEPTTSSSQRVKLQVHADENEILMNKWMCLIKLQQDVFKCFAQPQNSSLLISFISFVSFSFFLFFSAGSHWWVVGFSHPSLETSVSDLWVWQAGLSVGLKLPSADLVQEPGSKFRQHWPLGSVTGTTQQTYEDHFYVY